MVKSRVLLSLFLSHFFFACSDKEENLPQPQTQSQLLSSRKWQVRSITLSSATQPTVDLYALVRSCSQDDYIEFAPSSVYRVDEGTIKCSATEPQTRLGIWSLDSSDRQLTVAIDGFTTNYRIEELTSTTLKITVTRTQNNGTSSTQTNSYESI